MKRIYDVWTDAGLTTLVRSGMYYDRACAYALRMSIENKRDYAVCDANGTIIARYSNGARVD